MPDELTITTESEQIARAVRSWLNTYPDKPMRLVDVEFLGETSGLALETVQAAYKTRSYVTGGYQAQYQFAILYRTIPATNNERLEADEVLNDYAVWAEANQPTLPESCRYVRLTRNTNAALLERQPNDAETHVIQFTLLYEVNV